MALVNATVIIMKCNKAHKKFAVRTQQISNGDWVRTWAFPIDDEAVKHEHYEKQKVVGNLDCTEDYPGCPYCKGTAFVMCGACSKISCYSGGEEIVCEWCGTRSRVQVAEDKFDIAGSSF